MFFPMTPEVAKKLVELQRKHINTPITFEEYYNKRFLEECKYFVENPKFSFKYMMVMSHLQKTIREKCLKEYNKKYPGAIELQKKNDNANTNASQDNVKTNSSSATYATDTATATDAIESESINSDYDICDEITESTDSTVRRSKRLINKNQQDLK